MLPTRWSFGNSRSMEAAEHGSAATSTEGAAPAAPASPGATRNAKTRQQRMCAPATAAPIVATMLICVGRGFLGMWPFVYASSIKRDLGLTHSEVSMVATLGLVAGLLSFVVTPAAIKHVGRLRLAVAVVGPCLMAGHALCAVAVARKSFALLLAGIAVYGVGGAPPLALLYKKDLSDLVPPGQFMKARALSNVAFGAGAVGASYGLPQIQRAEGADWVVGLVDGMWVVFFASVAVGVLAVYATLRAEQHAEQHSGDDGDKGGGGGDKGGGGGGKAGGDGGDGTGATATGGTAKPRGWRAVLRAIGRDVRAQYSRKYLKEFPPDFWPLLQVGVLRTAFGTFVSFAPYALEHVHGLGVVQANAIAGVATAVSILSSFPLAVLVTRRRSWQKAYVVGGALVLTLGRVAAFVVFTVPLGYAEFVLMGLACSGLTNVSNGLFPAVLKERRGDLYVPAVSYFKVAATLVSTAVYQICFALFQHGAHWKNNGLNGRHTTPGELFMVAVGCVLLFVSCRAARIMPVVAAKKKKKQQQQQQREVEITPSEASRFARFRESWSDVAIEAERMEVRRGGHRPPSASADQHQLAEV